MPEIPNIKVEQIEQVGTSQIPLVKSIFSGPPLAIPQQPPITVTLGTPIVDVPGCVEYNPNNSKNDPNGNIVLCDGQYPSFKPIDYSPKDMVLSGPPEPIPAYKSGDSKVPKVIETPTTPKISIPDNTKTEEKKEEVSIEIKDPTFTDQYLPSTEEVITTVVIAVAASTSALFAKPLAKLLLKLIKPTIKKVIVIVKDKIGTKVKVLSVAERRQLQREARE